MEYQYQEEFLHVKLMLTKCVLDHLNLLACSFSAVSGQEPDAEVGFLDVLIMIAN